MPRLSIDTNILIYSIDTAEGTKHEQAIDLVGRSAALDTVLTQQVVGEFLNVLRKRGVAPGDNPHATAELLDTLFEIAPTPFTALLPAFDRAIRLKLQFWDSLIITVCLQRGVQYLLSEDLSDGQTIDGLTIVNPFDSRNRPLLGRLMEG